MSQDEEMLRKLILELQILERTGNSLQTRIGYINAAITEIQIANETLNGLKNEQIGTQLLIPIGGGSFIQAKVDNTNKIIVGIGANVSTEKDVTSAQEEIATRILELEKARTAVQKQLDDVVAQINRTQNQIRGMTRQQSEGTKDV